MLGMNLVNLIAVKICKVVQNRDLPQHIPCNLLTGGIIEKDRSSHYVLLVFLGIFHTIKRRVA